MPDPSGPDFRPVDDESRQATSSASDAAAGLKDEARDALQRGEEATRGRVAEGLDHAAEAARSAARHLEHDETWAAGLISHAADGLADVAETLRRNDLRSLLDRAADVARQQPALFTGASMVLGFALLRAAKSGTAAVTNTSSEVSHAR